MTNSQEKEDKFKVFKLAEEQKIKQEGIIDQFIVRNIAFNILPTLKSLNISPNMVTTISLITSCLSIWYIFNEKYIYGSFLFLLRYIFDCIDGPLARYTKTVSKFGDIYDHTVDAGSFIAFMIVASTKSYSIYFYIGIIILFITSMIHHTIISQRKTHKSDLIGSLLQYLPVDEKKFSWTQYCSTDVATLYACIAMVVDKNFKN